jgi:hypothetical protein
VSQRGRADPKSDSVDRGRAPVPDDRQVAESAAKSAAAGPRGRLSRPQLVKLLALFGAVVGVLTQATSFIDWVGDKLRGPPAEIVAPRILSVERQSPLSLRDYLNDVGKPLTAYARDELDQTGVVFALTLHIQGEQGSRFGLRWFIVDIDRGDRLRGPSFNQQPAIFEPRNQNQTRTYPVWIPTPPQAGEYEVTFSLVNAKRQPVAQKLSDPFRVKPRRVSAGGLRRGGHIVAGPIDERVAVGQSEQRLEAHQQGVPDEVGGYAQ